MEGEQEVGKAQTEAFRCLFGFKIEEASGWKSHRKNFLEDLGDK